jgi:CBS domain-containing protein
MKVTDVLKGKDQSKFIVDVGGRLSVAIESFSHSKTKCLVAIQDGKMAGVLSMRDVLLYIDRRGADALGDSVSEAMTKDAVFLTEEQTLQNAHELFIEKDINHLPVLRDGVFVGLITRVDVLTNKMEGADTDNQFLREYIVGANF